MVNASLNWASIVGIVLAVGGALLYFMRSFKPALARDYDVFFAAIGLLCGGILFFQGWRLDPILQFGQFLLAGTTVFFAYESVRLRGVTTEQARRSSYFDDEEPGPRPRVGGGRDQWGTDNDRFDEPEPLRRRIRSRGEELTDDHDDLYRPRRPARTAIPERAASRGARPADEWDSPSSPGGRPSPRSEPSYDPRAGRYGAPADNSPPAAGTSPGAFSFGARRRDRDEPRRGSRPVASADNLPRSSRRSGPGAEPMADRGPVLGTSGVPQGSPISDADFTPVRSGSRPSAGWPDAPAPRPGSGPSGPAPRSTEPPTGGPRDNSSRFDN
ncbi:Ycf66 family protein [Cyanobium sp. Morenito 9A2]|uniref:Ycf66 family protein n=1 Tax=Cyanobium sp. Morenito 9A2 TaxID=2823718 RepID=UPI0020CBD8C9|nr:Ycf66 family protein [Cyanobium sp. Morenito 9A2]MCP9850900.1 hypothetical protein [Cyanobium sp. Morenito 9A2]